MQPVSFWTFVLRCLARAAIESADFFEWKMKTGVTAIVLIGLGFLLHWWVKGLAQTKEEAYKYFVLVAAPAVLFLAALFLYHAFRAPYLIYVEEYGRMHGELETVRSARDQFEGMLSSKESTITSLRNEVETLKKQKPSKPAQSTVSAPPQVPQPLLAHIRIASQKTVVSTNPNLPFALEVVVQTDQTIQPVAFVFECDGDVGDGQGGVGAGAYAKPKKGIVEDHPNWFLIEWETPPFAPATPMVVTLLSKTAIRVTRIERVPFSWP